MPTTIDDIIASAANGNRDARDNALVSLALYVKRAEAAIVTQLGAVIADVAVMRGERGEATAPTGDIKPANLTVADAIDTRVIEYQDVKGVWCQRERDCCTMRVWYSGTLIWSGWFRLTGYTGNVTLPCRLVEREDADASPTSRGPIGGQAAE